MSLFPLNIMVEILINGTFQDISTYVYQRDGINITGGSQDKTPHEKPQPSQATFTLDNRDGRFTPNNTGGTYYPYLKRNVQVRISVVNATSSSGNTYTGYRFWGEIRDWPPKSDETGQDIFVSITANGPLRRLTSGGGKGSALARYYSSLTGSYAPIAYWACEEDPDTTQVQSGLSGGFNMNVTGTPRWKAISSFNGSHPIGVMNGSKWDGVTGQFGVSGNDLYITPGDYDWVAPVSTVEVRGWGSGAGGANGSTGVAGGGGEFAKNTAVALTVGNVYRIHIPAGGQGGAGDPTASNHGTAGDDMTFTDLATGTVLLRAHGGGVSSGSTGGTGGTGSTDPTHFNGGNGGSNPSNFRSGAGGGGSAGTAAAGNNGAAPTNDTTGNGAGGAAVTGGGKGGDGGDGNSSPHAADNGVAGSAPGGGGGGGGDTQGSNYNHPGGNGAPGQANLIYTGSGGGTLPSTNVFRFILFVPKHAGNSGKVLAQFVTGSTKIANVKVTFVSGSGGKLRVQGFDNGAVQSFDSGAQSWAVQGRTVMVSVELQNSGANVAWAFKAIDPGAKTLIGSASGTVTTAAVGNVSEVIVAPNQDITKTAMGHFSVQYALVDLRKVSRHLHGHHEELGIHRFIRLLNEEAMGNEPGYSETNDHWGFESGTQSWVATNGALTNPTTSVSTPAFDYNFVTKQTGAASWPTEGTHSLLLTCNGGGSPSAHSPSGTSGQNILPGDRVGIGGHFYTPAAAANMYIGVQFYTSGGATVGAEQDCTDYASSAGEIFTLTHHATAPATAAFFAVFWGNHGTLANNTLLYADDITVHPKFGPQTRKKLHNFLHEIHELDQGILRESRKLWGLGYRTRISLINQAAALTLDYSAGALSDDFSPVGVPDPAQGVRKRVPHFVGHGKHKHKKGFRVVFDEHNIKNDITIHRHKGSKIRVTLDSGSMSVQEPPAGTGRHRHRLAVAAHADEQLLALATHLLNLGTVTDERYPEVTVNLGRAGITGNALAPLMSACAGIECGDYIKVTNLPAWFPSSTAKQLVIGYTERLNAFEWQIKWNCTPESPWEITLTNLRRW